MRDFAIGSWITERRRDYRLDLLNSETIALIETIPNWSWRVNATDKKREEDARMLSEYINRFSWLKLNFNSQYKGTNIGKRSSLLMQKWHSEILPPRTKTILEAIPHWSSGLLHSKKLQKVAIVRAYAKDKGLETLKTNTIYLGINIPDFVRKCRYQYWDGTLDDEIISKLEAIPDWSWQPLRYSDEHMLGLLNEYYSAKERKHLKRSTIYKGEKLGLWVETKQQSYRKGKLPCWLTIALEKVPSWRWRTGKQERPINRSASPDRQSIRFPSGL